ncbi:hypothetical protein K402DRAFT_388371 [Aulographum hederae CBS 113979]|uniref:Uncharacterized protein n=1 Tax=Aulographum hederae CBS 113979 TaxID=1176131 RepID=A0A6G1HFH9_9PEZI|nr:hypothetical protein K402DRAFT_388371 [Aulographum hederae CBS 113979]
MASASPFKQSHDPVCCYFSLPTREPQPTAHWSDETPLSSPFAHYSTFPSPSNPLLASHPTTTYQSSLHTMDASKLLQLQTSAAYSRPAAQPLGANSANSSSSDTSESMTSADSPTMEALTYEDDLYRCSRCQRSSCIGTLPGNMIRIGTNSYYCNRCANIVGYGG